MADHKEEFSSDDLLRQAWGDLKGEYESPKPEAEAVELDEVDLPDVEELAGEKFSSSPVDTFVRAPRPPPPPTATHRPPPSPTTQRRPPPPPSRSEPPPPPVKTTTPSRGRGRWVLAGIAVFVILRIFNSFDGSDDASTESTSDAPTPFVNPTLDFDGFDSTSGLIFVGTAKVSNSAVSLTRKEPGNTAGAVWSPDRVAVGQGFETLFVFQIDHVSWFTIGDGFAFVIQNAGGQTVGGVASGNGYKGIPDSLAVEFDAVNHDYEGDPLTGVPDASAPDPLANHVAIHTMGSEPNTAHARAKLAHAGLDPVLLYDRQDHVALIRYVPGTLSVFVDDFDDPVLVAAVDLEAVLDLSGGNAFVGFTASTEGGFYSDHLIHRWWYGSPCLFAGCQDL